LTGQDKECRLGNLEQELIAAARGTTVKLSLTAVRKKGLLTVLREWIATNSESQ
jgi:hypothetical protein